MKVLGNKFFDTADDTEANGATTVRCPSTQSHTTERLAWKPCCKYVQVRVFTLDLVKIQSQHVMKDIVRVQISEVGLQDITNFRAAVACKGIDEVLVQAQPLQCKPGGIDTRTEACDDILVPRLSRLKEYDDAPF